MTMVHTAWLELVVKIPWVAPSDVLSRQHDDTLFSGSLFQMGVSTSDRRSML